MVLYYYVLIISQKHCDKSAFKLLWEVIAFVMFLTAIKLLREGIVLCCVSNPQLLWNV